MSRRSRSNSSKSHLAVYIIIGAAAVAALVAGKFILDNRAQHFSNLDELSASELKDSGTSLSGNEYRITGEISERRNLANNRGLFVSVKPENSEDTSLIPLHIPPGIDNINLERGHSYTFKVEINREGLPVAEDIKAQ